LKRDDIIFDAVLQHFLAFFGNLNFGLQFLAAIGIVGRK
jgi:hypothetical protein